MVVCTVLCPSEIPQTHHPGEGHTGEAWEDNFTHQHQQLVVLPNMDIMKELKLVEVDNLNGQILPYLWIAKFSRDGHSPCSPY